MSTQQILVQKDPKMKQLTEGIPDIDFKIKPAGSNIKKINGKYYDFGTKNRSFLLTARELIKVGIKNPYFMLEVKRPDLGVQDIDPRDPNITFEQTNKVIFECMQNIWYYIREVAVVPAKGSPKPIKLSLTRASAAATWCYDHGLDFLLCQPRQTWKTTIVLMLASYSFLFKLNNAVIPFMHTSEDFATKNIESFMDYVEALPPYLNPFYGRKRPGTKSVKYDAHKTTLLLRASADNEVNAMNKLRGTTLFDAVIDEWEYIKYIDFVKAGASPAAVQGRDIAKMCGFKCSMMYLSTPGNPETPEGKAAEKIIAQTPPFSETFYDMSNEDIEHMFDGMEKKSDIDGDPPEPVTCVYIEYNYKQLRKNQKWLKMQYNKSLETGRLDEYRRGVLLDRFRDDKTAIFFQEDIDFIKAKKRDPDHDMVLAKRFIMYIYDHKIYNIDRFKEVNYFDLHIPYMIGIDVATGSGGDNTAIVIVHPYTLEIVAEFKSPYMAEDDLIMAITQLSEMIPRGVFCIESNGPGKGVITWIHKSPLLSRFYCDPKLDMSKNPAVKETVEEQLKRESKERGYIGVNVGETNRKEMFSLLKSHLHGYRDKYTNKFIVEDITNLIRSKTGKILADNGYHDDIVMAYNHVLYVLSYGANLARFGIIKEYCTYNRSLSVLKEYEEKKSEERVSQLGLYDHQTLYEDRAAYDIVNHTGSTFDCDGTDEYGYRRQDYQGGGTPQPEGFGMTTDHDLAFMLEMIEKY